MYPYVFFILFFCLIFKISYAFAIMGVIAKAFFYYFGMFAIGKLYCLAAMIQGGFLENYFGARNNYYGNNNLVFH